jgi:hypothetical protein
MVSRAGRRPKDRRRLPGPGLAKPSVSRYWLKGATLVLVAICLVGLFSTQITDTDFWWHLKTGQYIVEHGSLPFPDPFAYTTSAVPRYPGEAQVRHFNLTHEWLSQVLMYLIYRVAGFPGIILTRAILLTTLCGLAGFLAARLSRKFYAGIAAACASASVLVTFAADRPAGIGARLVGAASSGAALG